MRVRADRYAYESVVASEQLYPSSQMLGEIIRVPVQPNKAITGRNAFAHEAGIHQDGMLKNPLTYEIMTPQSVGVPDSRLVLGKHSGRHALALRCEQLGHKFERRELDEVYRRFVVLADRIKRVQDSHLLELIHDIAGGSIQMKKFPAVPTAEISMPRAASAGVGSYEAFQAHAHAASPAPRGNSFGEHHADQEDYLWGV
jgi:isopropylmalate/homocitrate/citramalate synthase